jgi:hypothetical protein
MRKRLSISGYILLALIIIGLIASLRNYIIPICVFGIIFLLYKFPPSRWKLNRSSSASNSNGRKSGKRKSKTVPFRVINGSRTDDEDDRPKYH